MVSLPICEGVTNCGCGIAGHLQRDVSRGSPARSELHPWLRALGTTDLRGSWKTLDVQLLLPVGRRTCRCGLSPCVTCPALSPYWDMSNCVPRRAGLGWEDSSAQFLCLLGVLLLTFTPEKVLCLFLPWPGLTQLPQTSAMTFPAGIPSLDEAESPCAQAMPVLLGLEL